MKQRIQLACLAISLIFILSSCQKGDVTVFNGYWRLDHSEEIYPDHTVQYHDFAWHVVINDGVVDIYQNHKFFITENYQTNQDLATILMIGGTGRKVEKIGDQMIATSVDIDNYYVKMYYKPSTPQEVGLEGGGIK